MARVDYLQEQGTDLITQRVQMNTAKALQRFSQNEPVLIEEPGENGQIKAYTDQEYEIYHNQGKELSAISVAYANGMVQIYSIPDSNPDNLDRRIYARIRVVPLKINGVAIETDTTARNIRFWVN